MKYTIEGFAQEAMVKLGMGMEDAIVLRWFVDFYGSGRMVKVIDDGKEYSWVKYQGVIDDLPILGTTNRDKIAKIFRHLCEIGIMEHFTKKDKTGTFATYRLIPEAYEILTGTPSVTDPVPQNCGTPYLKTDGPKDSSINNSSTNKIERAQKEYEVRHKYGKNQKVSLTESKYAQLEAELGSKVLEAAIDTLDEYKYTSGRVYAQDDGAIRKWVLTQLRKDRPELFRKSAETPTKELDADILAVVQRANGGNK